MALNYYLSQIPTGKAKCPAPGAAAMQSVYPPLGNRHSCLNSGDTGDSRSGRFQMWAQVGDIRPEVLGSPEAEGGRAEEAILGL